MNNHVTFDIHNAQPRAQAVDSTIWISTPLTAEASGPHVTLFVGLEAATRLRDDLNKIVEYQKQIKALGEAIGRGP